VTWLGRLFGRSRPEAKFGSEDLWRELFGGRESRAGVTVNTARALEVATVLACVRVLANGVAQVPVKVYREEASGGRSVAREHPLHRLLHREPAPGRTSFAFRETLMFHLVMGGNAFVWKGQVGRDRELRRLVLLEPSRVTVKNDGERLSYRVRGDDGRIEVFDEDQIWHLRGPSWNGWMGLDAVRLARDAIGLGIALEETQADFQKGGAQTSGVLSIANTLSPERFEFLAAWLDKHAPGGPRAGKPLVVDQGTTYTPRSMTGRDAQMIESRKHQIEEICRALGVLPIMIGYADKTATYASAEQMFLAHVVHTLSPWFERIEQSADVSLLTAEERAAGLYVKFNPNALMRGAAADRAEFYTKALGAGGHGTAWMTPNEVRALEELDPIDGGEKLPSPEPAPPTA